jgi:hypothetical protein
MKRNHVSLLASTLVLAVICYGPRPCAAWSITQFGAIANDTSYTTAMANGKALYDAF